MTGGDILKIDQIVETNAGSVLKWLAHSADLVKVQNAKAKRGNK